MPILDIAIDIPAAFTPKCGKHNKQINNVGILKIKAQATFINAVVLVLPKPYKTPNTAAQIAKDGIDRAS